MRYLINEGFLNLPEGCDDRSQNVIYLEAAGGDTPVLVISRDELSAGETPEMYMGRQLKQMSRAVKHFKELSRSEGEAVLGGLPSYGFEAKFGPESDPRHQIQAFVIHDTNKVLIFGLTTMRPPNEKLRAQWNEIISSYCFNEA